MRLDWFSPIPDEETAISQYSASLVPTLAKSFEVCVWTEAPRPNRKALPGIAVESFTHRALPWKRLNGRLPNIYHVGNNFLFHGEIIQAARQCPGIVVMHDLAIHETVLNWFLHKGEGRAGYLNYLLHHYGEEAVRMAQDFLAGNGVDMHDLSNAYPLFDYAIENAMGIITHNPATFETLQQATLAPVLFAPLTYLPAAQLIPPIQRAPKAAPAKYKIVFYGYLGSTNRRLDVFLRVFARFPGRNRFEIHLAGRYPEAEVNGWIAEYKLAGSVILCGYLSDAQLDKLLCSADLAINLRWPSRGESSYTLLRAWNASLPILLTRTAYYATVPEACAAFVEPDNEEGDILHHLQQFLADPLPYYAQGIQGRQRLAAEHSTEAFVGYLQAFLPQVLAAAGRVYPQIAARQIASRFLADYPDPNARQALIDAAAGQIALWS